MVGETRSVKLASTDNGARPVFVKRSICRHLNQSARLASHV